MAKKSPVSQYLKNKKSAESDSATVRELRGQIGKLEKRIVKLRSREEIILDAVDLVMKDSPREIEIPEAPKFARKKGQKGEEIAILHLSDIQLGKITKSYNTAVAEERVLLTCHKAVQITNIRRTYSRIDEIHVYLGGDMVEGEDIFPHQAHEIDSSLYDQACVNGPRIFAKGLLILLEAFPKVRVCTVAGNHGRNGSKHTRSNPRTNWDQVLYHTLKMIMVGHPDNPRKGLDGRLDYRLAEDFYQVDPVFGWGNLLVHGHQVTGGHGGFPWYGMGKKAWGWIDAIEEEWVNIFLGHFHTPAMMTLGHRRAYANGTTESDNGFAKEQLAACGTPCQRLVFMDAKHGVIADSLIQLADPRPASMKRNARR